MWHDDLHNVNQLIACRDILNVVDEELAILLGAIDDNVNNFIRQLWT
jgi:hypothetical protein